MDALAGINVEEVIIETVLLIDAIDQVRKRGHHASADLMWRQIAPLMSDAQSGESKAGGRDAGGFAIVRCAVG